MLKTTTTTRFSSKLTKIFNISPFSIQTAEQQKQQQESQTARLAELELLLKALAAKTEVQHNYSFIIININENIH